MFHPKHILLPKRLLDGATEEEEEEEEQRRRRRRRREKPTSKGMKWMMEAAAAAAADGWMDGWRSDARVMCPDLKDFCSSPARSERRVQLLLIHSTPSTAKTNS